MFWSLKESCIKRQEWKKKVFAVAIDSMDSTLAVQQNAGWSSPVARQAHNLKVTGSNPVPATNEGRDESHGLRHF